MESVRMANPSLIQVIKIIRWVLCRYHGDYSLELAKKLAVEYLKEQEVIHA
jgi:hypothetical protein